MSPTARGKPKTTRKKTTAKRSPRKTAASKGSKTTKPKTTAKSTGKSKAKTTKPATSAGRKTSAKTKAKTAGSKTATRSRLSPKKRLSVVLERCDKAFGALSQPETSSVLEKAVYLVLREGLSATAVDKAMQALRAEYVDWNEVRVSSPSELSRTMLGTSRAGSLRKSHPFAQRVREMLDQVYGDRNDTSLEFLTELKARDQIEFLEDLDDLGIHNAYALVQWLSGDAKLTLVSPELARAAQRLGLTDTAAVTKVKKQLSDMLTGGELLAAQAHLNKLGEMEDSDWPNSLSEFTA